MHWILQADFDAEPGWPQLVRSLERLSLPHSIHDLSLPSRALRPDPSSSAFYAADVQALVLRLEEAFDDSEPRDGR